MRYLMFGAVLVAFVAAVVFASINTQPIALDLAFVKIETTTAFALLGFFGAGWVFGMLSAGLYMLRSLAERRRLRKSVELAETEVRSLRRISAQDAD